MTETMRANLTLSGMGSATGGIYNHVRVEGMGTVHGDLDCVECQIDGLATIHGAIKAKRVAISGKSKIYGAIEADQLTIDGHVLLDGNCTVSEKIGIRGYARIKGACETERFQADGVIHIEGLLNAEQIDIELEGKSSIKDVGCSRIRVIAHRRVWHRHLDAGQIEGDEITLAYTQAEAVQGNVVTLGRGCNVEHVVYHSDFNIDKNAVAAVVDHR